VNQTDQSIPGFNEAHYRAWHLAETPHEALTTELEWSLLRFQQAFEVCVSQIASVTGMSELSYTEIVVLHVIRMQERPKTAANIARQLNRDDIPNIQYCLRKLVKMGLCQKLNEGATKIFTYDVTEKGREVTDDYAAMRREVLTDRTNLIDQIDEKISDAIQLINLLTGIYDEAGRISATYATTRREVG